MGGGPVGGRVRSGGGQCESGGGGPGQVGLGWGGGGVGRGRGLVGSKIMGRGWCGVCEPRIEGKQRAELTRPS